MSGGNTFTQYAGKCGDESMNGAATRQMQPRR
jgi:hypothetical protein